MQNNVKLQLKLKTTKVHISMFKNKNFIDHPGWPEHLSPEQGMIQINLSLQTTFDALMPAVTLFNSSPGLQLLCPGNFSSSILNS